MSIDNIHELDPSLLSNLSEEHVERRFAEIEFLSIVEGFDQESLPLTLSDESGNTEVAITTTDDTVSDWTTREENGTDYIGGS